MEVNVWAVLPLNVTVPERSVNVPLFAKSPFIPITKLPAETSNVVPDPIVKSLAIVKASPNVTVPVPLVVIL